MGDGQIFPQKIVGVREILTVLGIGQRQQLQGAIDVGPIVHNDGRDGRGRGGSIREARLCRRLEAGSSGNWPVISFNLLAGVDSGGERLRGGGDGAGFGTCARNY